MIAARGLSARQMREIELYAAIEPVGEAMADYSGGDDPADDANRVERLKRLAKRQKREMAKMKE